MHPMFNQRREFSTLPHVLKKLQTPFYIITDLFLKKIKEDSHKETTGTSTAGWKCV